MKTFISSAIAAVALVTSTTAIPAFNEEHSDLQRRTDALPLPPCSQNDYEPYTYVGCFIEPNHQTLLYNPRLEWSTMTVETCTATCKTNGFKYAGLIYYGNCQCGTFLLLTSVPESECNAPCNGNTNQVCGANQRFSVYQDSAYSAVDLSTIASQYTAKGCYSEGEGYRAVHYRQDQLNFNSLTTEQCLTACGNLYYPLAATEYNGECYCGVALQGGSAPADSSKCNLACSGDSAEICGGAGYLNLYEAPILRTNQPCGALPPTTPTPSITSSATQTPTPTPSCVPSFVLDGASESIFNKKSTPFSVKIPCSDLDINNFTAFANFEPVTKMVATPQGITFEGFTDDYVLLYIYALDTTGKPFLGSFQLLFGAIDMPMLILDPTDNPVPGVVVQANSTIYPGVSQSCTTGEDGKCTFTNLIASSISLVARTGDNSIAVDGLAPSFGLVTMKLMPYVAPGPDDNFDISNGTTGWDGGVISEEPFLKMTKRDTSLVISTNGARTLQSAKKSFPVHPFTKVVFVKYKFITSEIPGGYFGTQFNDYYSISIRTDTGAFISTTNSMNALGRGAFDAQGATSWFTLQLSVPTNTKSVRFDIGVANVADGLYDSRIIVQKVGDLQCDNCGDCSTCPSDPMCQDTCINPPRTSCDFYRTCAQGQLGCTPSEYPLNYGEKNCNKFVKNINKFTSQGQNWVYDTMHCLQVAMVPVLKPCKETCASFGAAAFASHAKCYVDSGVCGLGCSDVVWIAATVNTDLFSLESFRQILQTAGGCFANIIQTLEGCGGDVLVVTTPMGMAIKITILLLKGLL